MRKVVVFVALLAVVVASCAPSTLPLPPIVTPKGLSFTRYETGSFGQFAQRWEYAEVAQQSDVDRWEAVELSFVSEGWATCRDLQQWDGYSQSGRATFAVKYQLCQRGAESLFWVVQYDLPSGQRDFDSARVKHFVYYDNGS